ncbi:MAG: hypothetical protein QMC77_03525 [Methanocellales archaeon]|nr:hypothetical protein [Methanocellales archaeon]
MFSDKHRFGKMLLIFTLILALCYYGYCKGPETEKPELRDYLNNAELFDGRELISPYSKVGNVTKDSFELIYDNGRSRIVVIGDADGLETGDIVSVKAIFRKDGFLELEELHVHKNLDIQWYVSLIPIPFVILFFFREFGFSRRKLEFKWRR